ncbi:FAD-dependent oxidoreductase [Thorsellia anophelis]|uniref:Pyruvate/2-oxoglutarate dehydrogenase complex, dihydrolipoamide dehydrogenase (E3) component n=1 Tax=Thorsellia anophelis DSM 18579 TaxID=1123402 RepID=A0A1H9YPM3_9GAMM|nr:bifunctional TVP38/TMEM64 family protein/FAD-dependent oxidoreductase [Thorsellia anophelis]SES71087.1 Pyruvate/2-oxoglutarate dehydrogenase complex, dihydrolipoamide dehydrogenase (E3) component [Thorsellia anophelis DSM 18579]
MNKKGLIVLIWGLLLFSFFYFDIGQYLTLERLQSNYKHWHHYIHSEVSHFLLAFALFFLTYVLITAASMPGAAILTLAAGAFFGFSYGLLLVSFASSIGATGAFLFARYLFRASLTSRFPDKLASINQGIDTEGAFYLLTLRLVPIFPFFLINTLMGLTRFRVVQFYLISQIGMLPGTIIFVFAGTELAAINSLDDIVSPSIILALTLLGIFPLLIKTGLRYIQYQKQHRSFSKPKSFDYNLIVIGAGAAGLVSSYIASSVKAKVLLVEKNLMGGDCLNYGCVPSKSLIKSASVAHLINHQHSHGLIPTSQFSLTDDGFKSIMHSIRSRIERIAPHDSVERYESLGVEVNLGEATLVDPWRVKIIDAMGKTKIVSAKRIILATGSKPNWLDRPGISEVNAQTTETLWQTLYERQSAPKHIVIEGAGPIGVELAQSFSRLGIKVTLITKHNEILMSEDSDVRQIALNILQKSGVEILLNSQSERYFTCEKEELVHHESLPYGVNILNQHTASRIVHFDLLILAIGRQVKLDGLGLENLGLEPNSLNTFKPNQFLQSPFESIYLAGDAVGKHQFTHVAAHHAWFATVNALFGSFKRFAVDERIIPICIYLDPVIARVGLTQENAKLNNIPYDLTTFDIAELDRAITDNENQGFIKVLTKPNSDKILGVSIVAHRADDLLAEFTLAMKYNLGLSKILRTIHPYPTWGEANKHVAGIWRSNRVGALTHKLLLSYHKWQRKE